MEIFIFGSILVALMVYVSTKIKKNAAQAYEPEVFETDEFSIAKPDGFIIPIKDDSPLEFEAFSKDYGRDDSERFRQVSAEIMTSDRNGFDQLVSTVRGDAGKVIEDIASNGTGRMHRIRTEENADGVMFEAFHKIIEGPEKVFHLRIRALPEHLDDYLRRIEEMLASFTLK